MIDITGKEIRTCVNEKSNCNGTPTLTPPVPETTMQVTYAPPDKDKSKIEMPAVGAVMVIAVILFMNRFRKKEKR